MWEKKSVLFNDMLKSMNVFILCEFHHIPKYKLHKLKFKKKTYYPLQYYRQENTLHICCAWPVNSKQKRMIG